MWLMVSVVLCDTNWRRKTKLKKVLRGLRDFFVLLPELIKARKDILLVKCQLLCHLETKGDPYGIILGDEIKMGLIDSIQCRKEPI